MTAFDIVAKLKLERSGFESDLKSAAKSISGFGSESERTGGKVGGLFKKLGGEAGSAGGKMGTAFNVATDAGMKVGGAVKSVGSKLAGVAKIAAGNVLAKGFEFGIQGAIKFGKAIYNIGAEYEQLVGGVDTLFGKASGQVQQYAQVAYKTAGLSANEYMETITGFSASLLQSLGGDTKAAAEVGNMAVVDMSDNANKMGTSMELIQNAYQGFAKQNYTIKLMSVA